MMKQLYFLALISLYFTTSFGQNAGDIIITEIMKDPDIVLDADGEWFEVYNTTAADIDMNGWTVSDLGVDSFVISGPLVVPAGGYAVLGRNGDVMFNGGVNVDYVYGVAMSLGNNDDEIILLTPGALLIDLVAYDAGPDFPDPVGASMELSQSDFDDTENDNGANWGVALNVFGDGDLGSPGGDNDFTLSVKHNNIKGFDLYPNPVTHGTVTITTAKNLSKQIIVFDVLGKQVLNRKLSGNVLDVSSLTSGIYIIKVTENTKTATRKLVIK